MGVTKVAPKLTKIETRLDKSGGIESERIIHTNGKIEYTNRNGVEVTTDKDAEIEALKKDLEIEKLKAELRQLKEGK